MHGMKNIVMIGGNRFCKSF